MCIQRERETEREGKKVTKKKIVRNIVNILKNKKIAKLMVRVKYHHM